MSTIKLIELIIAAIGLLLLNAAYVFQTAKLYRSKHTIGINKTAYLINFIGRWGFVVYGALVHGSIGIVLIAGQGFVGVLTVPIIYYGWRNFATQGNYVKLDFRTNLFFTRVILKTISVLLIIIGLLMRPEIGAFPVELHGPAAKWVPFAIALVFSGFTGLCFLPQTAQTIRTRKTKSISLMMLILFIIGNSMMIIGLIISSIDNKDIISYIAPIVLTMVSCISMLIILIVKIKNVRIALKSDPDYKIS